MATREDWIGKTGAEWARRTEALERLLGPAGEAGLGSLAARPGERILDIGCGAGASTVALADAVGSTGHVYGVDVSPDLLTLARARTEGLRNVTLLEEDAQTLRLPEPVDALFSCFGTMFFDDPTAALANLRGTLRPGSRAVFVAWREPGRNQWASVPMTFASEGVLLAAPSDGPGPFAWASRDVYRPLLERAGFRNTIAHTHEFMAEVSDGNDPDPVVRAVNFMLRIGPMASRLRGASEEVRSEAATFLQKRLARHVKDGAVRLLASAWIIETWA